MVEEDQSKIVPIAAELGLKGVHENFERLHQRVDLVETATRSILEILGGIVKMLKTNPALQKSLQATATDLEKARKLRELVINDK